MKQIQRSERSERDKGVRERNRREREKGANETEE